MTIEDVVDVQTAALEMKRGTIYYLEYFKYGNLEEPWIYSMDVRSEGDDHLSTVTIDDDDDGSYFVKIDFDEPNDTLTLYGKGHWDNDFDYEITVNVID